MFKYELPTLRFLIPFSSLLLTHIFIKQYIQVLSEHNLFHLIILSIIESVII